jgi:hypothetical protein
VRFGFAKFFHLTFIAVVLAGPSWSAGYRRPVNLKLLVLATTGEEAGLSAIRSFLEYQGTPYDVVKLAAGEPLPKLQDAERGLYQGVILTLGNLGVCDPGCRSALDGAGWTGLDNYLRDFGVRLLSYYTFPEARYGLTAAGGLATTDQRPLMAEFTSEAATVFRDLRMPGSVRIANAYTYLAQAMAEEGEITRPLLRSGSQVLAAIHEKPDGREFLALTFDNNSELFHSLLLQRGLIDWLTRGVHLGWRKSWLMPQVDDLFLPNYLFQLNVPECATSGGPSPGPDGQIPCQKLRIEGADLDAVARSQSEWQAKPQFSSVRVGMAYNGFGVKTEDDELLAAAKRLSRHFFWVSHTFSHRHLDCYASGPEGCRGASAEEGVFEVSENRAAGQRFGLPVDESSLVTPQISGLHNADFLHGAAQAGIRYLVSDTSRAEFIPTIPNTGQRSNYDPSIFLIPRRPTAIFYNAADGEPGRPGSEPDEYNFLFGPQGQFRRPDGQPFFAADQQYSELIQRESDLTLKYLLRGEMYPLMFHQANLWRYRGNLTLLTDLIGAVLAKYEAVSRLPVLSEQQTRIGELLEERLGYWKAGVSATVWPGDNRVTIHAERAAVAPMTGVCDTQCEEYGPFRVASVSMAAGETRSVRLAPREFIPQ